MTKKSGLSRLRTPRRLRAAFWGMLLSCLATSATTLAQGAAPEPDRAPPSPTEPAAPAVEAAPAAPPPGAPAPAQRGVLDPFASASAAPVLFLTENLDASLPLPALRERLAAALGRALVSPLDQRALGAHASIWLGMNDEYLVVRVAPPQRPDVWRQVPRSELGPDPIATVIKAVLEMLWADAFALAESREVQDPFCPPGMVCFDPRRAPSWPSRSELEVLDPWDSSYRRFTYSWEPPPWQYGVGGGYRPPNPWTQRYPDIEARGGAQDPARQRAPARGQTPAWPDAPSVDAREPEPDVAALRKPQHFALGLLAGGGVHQGGAFLRYEVNVLRRFPQFDVGLTYVGARGEPESFQKARRAAMALLQRRFVSSEFELDLGAAFGIFVANFDHHETEARPYLRGFLTFALPIGRSFDFLVQSEIGTTFASVPKTGAVECALTLGLRHKF
jgi:hypothetical protein